MRIRQLESFILVCELGSITQAAAALNIAQPALGSQISSLEEELGVPLLKRGRRGTTLTPAGEYFLDEARAILRRLAIAKAKVLEFAADERVDITIGLTSSLSAVLAAPLAQELSRLSGTVTVRLADDMSHILATRVAAGEFDFALAFNIEPQNGIVRKALLQEPIFFITGPKSNLNGSGPIDLVELTKAVFAIPTDKGQILHMVKAELAQRGLPINIAYQIESMDAIKRLIAQGAASAVLPFGIVAPEVEAGTLLAREIVSPSLMRTLYVLQPADRDQSATQQSVLSIIENLMTHLLKVGPFVRLEENENAPAM